MQVIPQPGLARPRSDSRSKEKKENLPQPSRAPAPMRGQEASDRICLGGSESTEYGAAVTRECPGRLLKGGMRSESFLSGWETLDNLWQKRGGRGVLGKDTDTRRDKVSLGNYPDYRSK